MGRIMALVYYIQQTVFGVIMDGVCGIYLILSSGGR